MKEGMTSRERVLVSLNHQEPDRVPIDLGGTPCSTLTVSVYNELKKYLNVVSKTRLWSKVHQITLIDEEVLQKFSVDTRALNAKPLNHPKAVEYPDGTYIDEWGVTFRRSSSGPSFYYDMIDQPLKKATIRDLEEFDWPDPQSLIKMEGLREEAKQLHENTDYAIIGATFPSSIFELSWYLRSFERFLMDLIDNKKFAHALMNRITNIQKEKIKIFLDTVGENIDIVYIADDIAMQDSAIMSPEIYREMIKPYHKEYFNFIKENSKAKLFYHCCGSVYPFINDLIEIGADVLDPIQVSAKDMDTSRLKREFGDRISFWGAIDTQHVLPDGTTKEVEEEVKKRIHDLAPGGGYVLTSVHNIQFGVSPENICAMLDAAKKYGRYPLSL